jgi:hypothetical protein
VMTSLMISSTGAGIERAELEAGRNTQDEALACCSFGSTTHHIPEYNRLSTFMGSLQTLIGRKFDDHQSDSLKDGKLDIRVEYRGEEK